jgi:hypothetical protein
VIDEGLVAAVFQLADTVADFEDSDLDQPWQWRAHREGVRFALLGTYHELRDLAVRLAQERAQEGSPLTTAQRTLAPYHAGYRELQALLLGMNDDLFRRRPATGQWPLSTILGHIIAAQRTFFTLVHHGVARQRTDEELPAELPADAVDELLKGLGAFDVVWEEESLPAMMAYFEQLHLRVLELCSDISDTEMSGTSLWWEGEPYPLLYRMLRFDAHLRQHMVQAEQALALLGRPLSEARQLLRLVYRALADVESAGFGALDVGMARRQELAAAIKERADEVGTVVATARALQAAVVANDVEQVRSLLETMPSLANASSRERLPLILQAHYRQQGSIVNAFIEAGAELDVFIGAALGRLDVVEQEVKAWDGWVNYHGSDGFTPLQLACYFGHEEVVRFLLGRGADANATAENEQKIRPLHAAAANGDRAIVEMLLKAGADVNAPQIHGFTPLHTAADRDDVALAELLLAYGADPAATDDEGRPALALARARGRETIAAYLQQATRHREEG